MPVGLMVAYVSVLIISGVALLVLAGVGFGQDVGARVVEAVAAAALLGYAGYLLLFGGGAVFVSVWAVVGPVLGIRNAVRARRRQRIRQEQLAATYAADARDGGNRDRLSA
ncbi:MAG: hypothetical protein QOI74_1228 [Micromonosporaceae bacterium]|jgi:hypothetical protein|nr:hypothetical protein [Micromonosporaceae bacterium]